MKLNYIIAVLFAIATVSGCDNSSTAASSKPAEQTQPAKAEFNYMTADEVANAVRSKEKVSVLDIQPKDKFDEQHIVDAIPTYAYPAKTEEEKALLKEGLAKIPAENKIIVVCPGGRSGATNTINYFKNELGISNDRMFILEKGANGWSGDKLADVTVKK